MGSRQDNHDIDTSTSQLKLFIFDLTFSLQYINMPVVFILNAITHLVHLCRFCYEGSEVGL